MIWFQEANYYTQLTFIACNKYSNLNNLQLYGIKFCYLIQIIFKRFYRPIDGTLTASSTARKNGPMSNGNEGVLHTPQIFRTGTSTSYYNLMLNQGYLRGKSYLSTRDTLSVF